MCDKYTIDPKSIGLQSPKIFNISPGAVIIVILGGAVFCYALLKQFFADKQDSSEDDEVKQEKAQNTSQPTKHT